MKTNDKKYYKFNLGEKAMKNLIRNSEKNCMSILFIVLIAMMFSVKDTNAYVGSLSAVHVKAAFEGLYDESQGALTKDVLVVVYLRNAERLPDKSTRGQARK